MPDLRSELVRTLIKHTGEGTMKWSATADDDSVVAILGSGRVIVAGEDNNGSLDIVIRVYDSSGNNVETFSDVDLKRLTGSDWFPNLNGLLGDARRSALGADDVLEAIISELNKEDDIPF